MTKLQLIANQIISDYEILAKDVGLMLFVNNQPGLVEEMKRLNEKLKLWALECARIIDKANILEDKTESLKEEAQRIKEEGHCEEENLSKGQREDKT